MRDAAGQAAERFHLLGMEQRLARLLERQLRIAPFGHVARDLGKPQQRAVVVTNGVDHHARPEARAILAHPPALVLEAALALG